MNRQIFLFCISSIIVIHTIDYEAPVKNISDYEDDHEERIDDDYNSDYNSDEDEDEEREARQLFRPIRFRRPLLSPRVASLFATIPTLFGINNI